MANCFPPCNKDSLGCAVAKYCADYNYTWQGAVPAGKGWMGTNQGFGCGSSCAGARQGFCSLYGVTCPDGHTKVCYGDACPGSGSYGMTMTPAGKGDWCAQNLGLGGLGCSQLGLIGVVAFFGIMVLVVLKR